MSYETSVPIACITRLFKYYKYKYKNIKKFFNGRRVGGLTHFRLFCYSVRKSGLNTCVFPSQGKVKREKLFSSNFLFVRIIESIIRKSKKIKTEGKNIKGNNTNYTLFKI